MVKLQPHILGGKAFCWSGAGLATEYLPILCLSLLDRTMLE